MSKTRTTLARASWPIVTIAVSVRTGPLICARYAENARNVPRVTEPRIASQPPSASTPTMPSDGIAVSAGLYRAVSRIIRSREPNSPVLVASSRSCSCSSWPKPLTTRTPPMLSSTMPATSPDSCWACQLAGNRRRRDASAMNHSDGATATATRVKMGDSVSIMTIEMMNRAMLPRVTGIIDSRPCTMFRSEIDRPTSWPVWISSWRLPSSRDRAPNRSFRRSCWTSRAIRPPV